MVERNQYVHPGMKLEPVKISCGIYQLSSVDPYGFDPYISAANGPTKEMFTTALLNSGRASTETLSTPGLGMIIASLTTKQVRGKEFLFSLGFMQVGTQVRNPNSSNDILLFVKTYPQQPVK